MDSETSQTEIQYKKLKRKKWLFDEELLLLNIWEDTEEELRKCKRNSHIYARMAKEMGGKFTSQEVHIKVSNLAQRYRSERKDLERLGGGPSKWAHYEHIHKIIGSYAINSNTPPTEEFINNSNESTNSTRVHTLANVKVAEDMNPRRHEPEFNDAYLHREKKHTRSQNITQTFDASAAESLIKMGQFLGTHRTLQKAKEDCFAEFISSELKEIRSVVLYEEATASIFKLVRKVKAKDRRLFHDGQLHATLVHNEDIQSIPSSSASSCSDPLSNTENSCDYETQSFPKQSQKISTTPVRLKTNQAATKISKTNFPSNEVLRSDIKIEVDV